MTVIDHGTLTPDHQHRFTDALDQVFFHLGSSLDDVQARKVTGYLTDGKNLPAAETLALVAATRKRAVSEQDLSVLRTVIEAYKGNLSNIRRLESQTAEAPTLSMKAPRTLRLV